MKRTGLIFCIIILSLLAVSSVSAQKGDPKKEVSISYTWSRIQSHGSNQIAIWIEDQSGKHIRTLFATSFTATGGYSYRPTSLSEWVKKFDLKNASKEMVDAVSGSTPQPGRQTVKWDGKDQSGKAVPSGTYVVRMEANIHNEDKMFFSGEILTGSGDQQTKGVITFSKPELSSGNLLFKDVLVEYK